MNFSEKYIEPHELLLKMNSFSDNFVNTQRCDTNGLIDYENFPSDSVDPLQELNTEAVQAKSYRIQRIVFTEPLKNILNEENTLEGSTEGYDKDNKEEITFIDNVMVQSKAGRKYKKYHINIEDPCNLRCPQSNCTSTFTSTKLLKAHIRKVHCADRNKYICERCGRGFSAQYLLDRHTMVHTEKKVECPVCGTMLSGRTSLSTHLRCHSNLRSHQCSICTKSFSRASTLATHVKFVHRDKPLECDQCKVRFSSRKQWSEHIMSKQHRRKKGVASTSKDP